MLWYSANGCTESPSHASAPSAVTVTSPVSLSVTLSGEPRKYNAPSLYTEITLLRALMRDKYGCVGASTNVSVPAMFCPVLSVPEMS